MNTNMFEILVMLKLYKNKRILIFKPMFLLTFSKHLSDIKGKYLNSVELPIISQLLNF